MSDDTSAIIFYLYLLAYWIDDKTPVWKVLIFVWFLICRSITSIIKTDTKWLNWFSRLFLFNYRFSVGHFCLGKNRVRLSIASFNYGKWFWSFWFDQHIHIHSGYVRCVVIPPGARPSNTYASNLFKLIFSLELDKNCMRRWLYSLRVVQLVLKLAVGDVDGTFITCKSRPY